MNWVRKWQSEVADAECAMRLWPTCWYGTVADPGSTCGQQYELRKIAVKLKDRVVRSIARRYSVVILRSELAALGSPAQLTRVLSNLVKNKRLVRVGLGIYAKTRLNKFTGEAATAATFEEIAAEAFRKLDIDVSHGQLARDYNAGKTTQVPMLATVDTGRRRISRRISLGSRTVTYERSSKRMPKEPQP
ncbi:S-adenosylhomocysteine hydrolase (modular protein) [Paraburkholderia dioscoreae]|uniref:S-adenosylhomocysteine hydrolase (Modular protein) n=2 Tax=Burkholderiaceae TaxID=119060 RepID=A0A5Q4Z887_9BURK|nr:S-adenosylhomocysteine hydrolase (modular protein) [Paraburkholderia dioscoreae]